MNLQKLKSGSDIRGTAISGVKGQEVDLTVDAVESITNAFVIWLQKNIKFNNNLKIAVGHDSRLSASSIVKTITDILVKNGCYVYLCGLVSTPSMFLMTQYDSTQCNAAIMVTASHHPYNKNGLKFFTKNSGLTGADIQSMIDIANTNPQVPDKQMQSKVIQDDFLALYCNTLINKIKDETKQELPLKNLKIVVDAGNGAGGFFATRVLHKLGADITGSQFLEPDGNFKNHIPNPEDKTAMQSICNCVLKNKADLGIIFDTDVDRSAVVSQDGKPINRNRLIALISAILLAEKKGIIVTDSITSDGLTQFIVNSGGIHHRFKRGYNNVITEAKRLNDNGQYAPLAIETSGHAAFLENYFLDDGAYLVVRLLIKMAQLKAQNKTLISLIDNLSEPAEELEVRLDLLEPDFKAQGTQIINKLTEYAKTHLQLVTPNCEGVRVNVPQHDGWFLARLSVHDPVLPINIESNIKGGAEKIKKLIFTILGEKNV